MAAVERARSATVKTQRAPDYIAAIEAFYKDSDKVAHRDRALTWRNAMQQLSARYPEDREAAIFFALALLRTAPANDRTYANQKQAAGILNRILPDQPDHPGIAHYVIHTTIRLSLRSSPYPRREVTPGLRPQHPRIAHAITIFTALGLWQDSIDSNLAFAAAARSDVAKKLPGATSQDQLPGICRSNRPARTRKPGTWLKRQPPCRK